MSRRLRLAGAYLAGDVDPPLAPAGVFLNNQQTNSIQVNWASNSEPDIADYRIYRSTTSALTGFSIVGTVSAPGTSYADTGFVSTQSTWYRVTARDDFGNESDFSSTVQHTPTSSAGDPYDLYDTDSQGRGTIPFTVTWPTEPQGALTPITVTNNTELATAIATANAEITVAAGSYGSLSISNNDQRWILDNNAIFSGLGISSGTSRISISGGTFRPGVASDINLIGDDLYFENVLIDEVATVACGVGDLMCNRVAWVHCTISAYVQGLFTPGATASASQVKGSDFIVAGCVIEGGMDPADSGNESAIRIMSMEDVILVDNWAQCGVVGSFVKHTYRSHYGNQNYWMRNNMSYYGDFILMSARTGSSTPTPHDYCGAHWVYDHTCYYPSNNPGSWPTGAGTDMASRRNDVDATVWPEPFTTDGNVTYDHRETNPAGVDNVTSSRWRWSPQAGDVTGSNQRFPYQAPPSLVGYTVAGGVQVGADH